MWCGRRWCHYQFVRLELNHFSQGFNFDKCRVESNIDNWSRHTSHKPSDYKVLLKVRVCCSKSSYVPQPLYRLRVCGIWTGVFEFLKLRNKNDSLLATTDVLWTLELLARTTRLNTLFFYRSCTNLLRKSWSSRTTCNGTSSIDFHYYLVCRRNNVDL